MKTELAVVYCHQRVALIDVRIFLNINFVDEALHTRIDVDKVLLNLRIVGVLAPNVNKSAANPRDSAQYKYDYHDVCHRLFCSLVHFYLLFGGMITL
jgi:hypothetical protein